MTRYTRTHTYTRASTSTYEKTRTHMRTHNYGQVHTTHAYTAPKKPSAASKEDEDDVPLGQKVKGSAPKPAPKPVAKPPPPKPAAKVET